MTRYSDTVESIDFTVLSRLTRYSVKFFYIYCSIVLLLLLKKRKYIEINNNRVPCHRDKKIERQKLQLPAFQSLTTE